MNAGYIANVGGNYNNGLNTGAFYLNVNNSPTNTNDNNGSHLVYWINYGEKVPKGWFLQV